jgi:hypothetical protein
MLITYRQIGRQDEQADRNERKTGKHNRGPSCSKAVKTSRDRQTEVLMDSKAGRTDSQRLLYVNIYKDRETVRT